MKHYFDYFEEYDEERENLLYETEGQDEPSGEEGSTTPFGEAARRCSAMWRRNVPNPRM